MRAWRNSVWIVVAVTMLSCPANSVENAESALSRADSDMTAWEEMTSNASSIQGWRRARLLEHFREINALSVSPSPAWAHDSGKCPSAALFGEDAAYFPGCAKGYWYTAVVPRSSAQMCLELTERRVRKITFMGDSLVRHLFVALATYLKDDFRAGALVPWADTDCVHRGQYTEARCRGQIDHEALICNGTIRAKLDYSAWGVPTEAGGADILLWSHGTHSLNPNWSFNAVGAELAMQFVAPVCRGWGEALRRKVVWTSLHAGFSTPDKAAFAVKRNSNAWRRSYNARMEASLRTSCGVRLFADFFDPIIKAIVQLPDFGDLT